MFDKGYNDGVAAYNNDLRKGRVARENSEIRTRALDSTNNLSNLKWLSDQEVSAYFIGFVMGYTSRSG